MRVTRIDNSEFGFENRLELKFERISIREAAQLLGKTEDTLDLFDDRGNHIARAIWPQGSAAYMYSEGDDFDPHAPELSTYKY